MALVILSMESLKDLDFGKASAMFNVALQRAVQDCVDRPGDKTKRNVTFQVDLKPIVDAEGELEAVSVKCLAKHRVPNQAVREIQLIPRRDKGKHVLAFNPDSADARQADLGFTDAEGNS